MEEKTKKILKRLVIWFVILTIVVFWVENVYFGISLLDQQDSQQTEDSSRNSSDPIEFVQIKGGLYTYLVNSSGEDNYDDQDATSAEDIVGWLLDLKYDDTVKGVVIEIDSPGGSPVAAEEIMTTIKNMGKPTAAVIRGTGTSGAYLIASGANKIFASQMSDIGGIGVTMSYLDYSNQNLKEGLTYQQLSSGKFKDTGNQDKPLTYEERQLIMRDINLMHQIFIKNVAENRGLEVTKVQALADGSSMLGDAAKKNGLIDQIGDSFSAYDWMKTQITTSTDNY